MHKLSQPLAMHDYERIQACYFPGAPENYLYSQQYDKGYLADPPYVALTSLYFLVA